MIVTAQAKLYAGVLVLGIALGLGGGWKLWHPRAPVVETAAPANRQKDSSLVLERAPDPKARPAQLMPKGATLERTVRVTVQPRAETNVATNAPLVQSPPTVSDANATALFVDGRETEPPRTVSPVPCPPVTVQLSLVRLADQTHRVIASSPDGAVVGGVDIPVENAAPQRVLRWSLSAIRASGPNDYGGLVGHDIGPLNVQVGAIQLGGKLNTLVGIGLRF